jgi:hypothetical protein
MFQNEIADPVYQTAARRGRQLAPRTIQRRARGAYRRVDIGRIAFGHRRQAHSGGGVKDIEGLARFGLNPFAIDQHGARLGQSFAQRGGHAVEGRCRSLDIHGVSLSEFCFVRKLCAIRGLPENRP